MKATYRSKRSLALFALCQCLAGGAVAAPGWLVATASEAVHGGEVIELEVVRPDAATPWPESLRLHLLAPDGRAENLPLQGAAPPADALRHTYAVQLPKASEGMLRAELADLRSNRLALLVKPQQVAGDAIAQMTAPGNGGAVTGPRFDPLPDDEPALSANEPMYVVFGARDGTNARFQLSFKYRPFDTQSLPARLIPALGQMYFGYTQTSLWDLAGDSRPFRDTSYRPSLFWQGRVGDAGGLAPVFLRGGYEHESNGKDDIRSRSIDTLFLQPAWRKDFASGQTLFFAPRFHTYIDRDDNRDIARYRGYADWLLRYGNEDGWLFSTRLRRGTSGHGSGQFDLSHPLREPLFSRVGGFLHFQVFTGYGETLLDYNVKNAPQFRIGFSIVR